MVVDVSGLPWLTVLCLVTGIAPFVLVGVLARYRGKPGVDWFIVSLLFYGGWCLTYGLSLFVADYELRVAFETVSWMAFLCIGYPFLGFALDYTGRSDLRKSWLFAALGLGPAVGVGLVATNAWHGLVWQDPTIVRAYDAVLLDYAIQPLGFAAASVGLTYSGIAVLLLLDTVLNYGPLYRREAIAVALSPLPPSVGLIVWWFGLGPVDAVNWGVVASLPHAALDAYAFVGKNMFATSPATRRVADETALDTLPDPVVVLDESDRVVEFNDAAARVFDGLSADRIGTPVSAVLPIEFPGSDDYVSVSGESGRYEFAVDETSLSDPRGAVVGSTVLFRDITDEREREQRLEVLNRVLRHNLRNKLTAIGGYAAQIEADAGDPELSRWARKIGDSGDELVAIGEKARTFDSLRQTDVTPVRLDVETFLADVVSDLTADYPEARIDTRVDVAGTVRTDPDLLGLALRNVVENAIVHDDSDAPQIHVSARESEESLVIEIQDEGPGIPEQELAVVADGVESDLEHGSGIGLWIVEWSMRRLEGDVRFESTDEGSRVTLVVPAETTVDPPPKAETNGHK